jgi:hypothetical protein
MQELYEQHTASPVGDQFRKHPTYAANTIRSFAQDALTDDGEQFIPRVLYAIDLGCFIPGSSPHNFVAFFTWQTFLLRHGLAMVCYIYQLVALNVGPNQLK